MDFTIVCNAPECARGHQLLGRQDQYHPCHYATRAIFSFVGQWIYLGDCHLLLLELLFLLLSSVPGVFEFDDSSFQMSISTATILVSDGAAGKSYVKFPWLSHPIMSPREEGKKGRFLLHSPSWSTSLRRYLCQLDLVSIVLWVIMGFLHEIVIFSIPWLPTVGH